MDIKIGNKEYKVITAKTKEELTRGLRGTEKLEANEGMLFYLSDKKTRQVFNMVDMKFPLDIVFINLDDEVCDIRENCKPGTKVIVGSCDNGDYIAYVLEVKPNSNIDIGDELDFVEDTLPVMKVIAPDGSTQMELWGGERIFRRAFTKLIIKWAKLAKEEEDLLKLESIYKRLGKKMFKEIKALDDRPAEYVQTPE